MATPITKEELSVRKTITDEKWREAIATYRANYPNSEKECERICEYMKRLGFDCPQRIFAAAMMQLHVDIATETGEMLGKEDFHESEDPSRN